MNRSDDTLPFRHATRIVNAFQWDVGRLGLGIVGRDLDGVAMLFVLLRQALREGDRDLSVHGTAVSLQRPAETIRRTAARLVASSLIEKAGRTYRIAPNLRARPDIVRLERDVRARFGEMLGQFASAGYDLPHGLYDQADRVRTVAALDIYLSVFELAEAHVRFPMLLHVVGAVTILNAAPLLADPRLGLLYGFDRTIPPDHLRRPVGLAEIAAQTGFPYPTVWRHVAAAQASGVLRRVGDGYLIGDRLIDDVAVSRLSRIKIKYVRRILHDLARGTAADHAGERKPPVSQFGEAIA